MRTMYDSVTPVKIPASAEMVAGYINGRYAWTTTDWGRFFHASHVRIDVTGSAPFFSDVLDVETGDATPAGAAEWVHQRMGRGWWSAIYTDLANLPAVREAVAGLDVEFWVAHWTGVIPAAELIASYGPRVCAVQYESTTDYDLSVVPNAKWFPAPIVKM